MLARSIAAAALSAAAVVLVLLASRPDPGVPPARLALSVESGAPSLSRPDGTAAEAGDAAAGDVLRTARAAVVRLGDRATIALDAGSEVGLVSSHEVALRAGRARFEVTHATPPFVVRAAGVRVEDAGTVFSAEVDGGEAGRLDVAVEEGAVVAGGTRLGPGEGASFVGGLPRGAPWSLSAAPTLALETPASPPRAGEAVSIRLVLRNDTERPLRLAPGDGGPWFVEVTAPSGAAVPVRVTSDRVVPDPPAPAQDESWVGEPWVLQPGERRSITVRFASTFTVPGTYRLRALYRPAGFGGGVASDVHTLTTVR